jgi:hypothetical protein
MDTEVDDNGVHKMEREAKYFYGTEIWVCKTCGMRLSIVWKPEYRRVVLTDGDGSVIHVDGKTGAVLDSPELSKALFDASNVDDYRLDPWKAWIESSDFDNLWTKRMN